MKNSYKNKNLIILFLFSDNNCKKSVYDNHKLHFSDPANDNLPYTPIIDINEFITVQDVMEYLGLGPNGALLYCMEFVEEYADNIAERIKNKTDHYFLIDCPGQVCFALAAIN